MNTRPGALQLVVLVLGAAAPLVTACDVVFRLDRITNAAPNYYTCDCQCSRRVIAPQGGTVLAGPARLPVRGFITAGTGGEILDGPVDAELNGTPLTWWEVRFDDGIEGWLQQDLLALANETMVTKAAQTCVPAEFNANLGGTEPTLADLQPVCRGTVATEAQARVNEKLAPLGIFHCKCDAQSVRFVDHDPSCDQPCPGGAPACLLAGSDPPVPTPTLFSEALLQPTSTCRVTGGAELSAGGRTPKQQPSIEGLVQIYGRPCAAGQGCPAGMSYQLTGDDIEFDSGSIFASDPKFVGLALTGATEPGVINLGPLLGGHIGEVPAGTAFSAVRAQRSGQPAPFSFSGRNTAGIALLMSWPNKTCRLAGQVVGQAEGDPGEGTLDAQLEVLLDGALENQPPLAEAGADQTVECTSPAGASVTLDASGSVDRDSNIAFYDWRRGSPTGPQLARPSPAPSAQTTQPLGHQSYHVLVVDRLFSATSDSVGISVVDTTAPVIACNAPATITPSDVPDKKRGGTLSFKATGGDLCTGVGALAIQSYWCARPTSCRVRLEGDTITILDSGGVGNTIRWTVAARDGNGNDTTRTCEVQVVRKKETGSP